MATIEQVIVIGSGPAGLTAAIYLARFGLNPLIIDGPQPGGQLMWTTYIENWPGIPKIRGTELMKNLRDHATGFGARIVAENVLSIDLSVDTQTATQTDLETEQTREFIVKTDKNSYKTRSVIIASGAHARRLNCPGEETYWGKGVSPCAVCDGAFFRDQPVVVVGGGNSALENAIFLRQYTDRITIIHLHEKFSATEESMLKTVKTDPAFSSIFNSTITKIVGDGQLVTGVQITNQKTGQTTNLPTNAVFIAIGQVPSSDFVRKTLELTPRGHIALKNSTQTSIPGIFAAGDVVDAHYRQAITSAGTGCMAALDVQKYLALTP